MLGLYNNFPRSVHKVVGFATSISERTLQTALVEAFHKLNKGTFSLEEVAIPSVPQCTLIFEFGVAEGDDFNYLDDEERDRLLKAIRKKPFSTMDFLCVIRYYKVRNETRTPLRFDYYMFRFIFRKKIGRMRVFHEKGLMYVSPKDLPWFIVDKINAQFSRKMLKAREVA
jgi:hypothetical protein